MPTLLKKKADLAKKEKPGEAQKAPLLKPPVLDERPVAGASRDRQSESSFLAFTIQRKHDGVTHLYELVTVRVDAVEDTDLFKVTEVRRDPGTTREIVESKIFRDLAEIVF